MNVEIDEGIARRVLAVVDAGLVQGMGEPIPGKMGVEAAVCYALGLPHGDDPSCVAPAVRWLTIRLNDSRWSSPQARARGLRRLAIAQLGTAGSLDEREFARRVARLAIQICVPAAMCAAARLYGGATKERMLHAAALCERDPSRENALEAHAAAHAAYAAADDAAYYAADAAYYAAAAFAACAADAAADAAAHAAYAAADDAAFAAADAAYYAAAHAAADAAADAHLSDFAEGVVQILRDMGSPGCAFLHLTEAA